MADITIRNSSVVASAPRTERIHALALIGSAARVFLKALVSFLGVGESAHAPARRPSRGFNDRAAEWSLFDVTGTSTSNLVRGSNR